MPFLFVEGTGPYTVNVTVTNASMKGTQPWPATLTLDVDAVGPSIYVAESTQANFGAGQQLMFSFPFSIPWGDVGVGNIVAKVKDPTGVVLDEASVGFTIEEVPIDYGADVIVT